MGLPWVKAETSIHCLFTDYITARPNTQDLRPTPKSKPNPNPDARDSNSTATIEEMNEDPMIPVTQKETIRSSLSLRLTSILTLALTVTLTLALTFTQTLDL